jgi:hypothetical protein
MRTLGLGAGHYCRALKNCLDNRLLPGEREIVPECPQLLGIANESRQRRCLAGLRELAIRCLDPPLYRFACSHPLTKGYGLLSVQPCQFDKVLHLGVPIDFERLNRAALLWVGQRLGELGRIEAIEN